MLRAIVVDDEINLRILARLVLEGDGAAEVVGEACTAGAAVDMIRELNPDVAIIDIHLPDMSGVELIEQVRHDDLPVRLVAYSSDDLALEDALRAGADSAVLKTGRSEDLLAALVA